MINNRIQLLRKTLKLTQKQFAKSIHLSQSHVASIETGVRDVTERVIRDICTTFNVNQDWLLNGIEPIFIDFTQNLDVSLEAKELGKSYSLLSESQKKVVKAMITEFLSQSPTS